jgi:hypothetical protein
MARSFNLSLGQTVVLAVTGSLLMASTFPLMAVFRLNHHNGIISLLIRLILSFSPMLLGIILSAKANNHIKHRTMARGGARNLSWHLRVHPLAGVPRRTARRLLHRVCSDLPSLLT